MTRTDVVASNGPQAAGAAPKRRGSFRAARRLPVLPIALLLAVVFVMPTALAAGATTTGYGQTPPAPKTGTTPTPNSGTSPSKEKTAPTKSTPATTTTPAKTSSVPTTTKSAKASSLPFTGLDLRFTVGVGLILMGAGFSIVMVQRRQRRNSGR